MTLVLASGSCARQDTAPSYTPPTLPDVSADGTVLGSPADAGPPADIPPAPEVLETTDTAADTAQPDTRAPDPYPLDWVLPPAGWCDDPEHLAIVDLTVDGDTVQLEDGLETRVRVIGVDAPEIFEDECWAQQAKDSLIALAPWDAEVCLLHDSNSSPVDPFGRLLRYVFVRHGAEQEWGMSNVRLVRVGAAPAFHKYLKGKDYESRFIQAEQQAIEDKVGGWIPCGW